MHFHLKLIEKVCCSSWLSLVFWFYFCNGNCFWQRTVSASVAVMVCSLSENSKERKENKQNRTNYTLATTKVFVTNENVSYFLINQSKTKPFTEDLKITKNRRNWLNQLNSTWRRLRVVPHLSSGIVERVNTSARENHPTREKAIVLLFWWPDGDGRGCYPSRLYAQANNTLLDLQNSSDDTKTDGSSIIVLLVF